MALETAVYLVTRDIAIRSGLKDQRYRIADGRFVLDNKDLSRVRFTIDEYISGLSGVEKSDEQTAQTLIAQNGYKRGDIGTENTEEVDEAAENTEAADTPEEENEQTNEEE